MILEIDSLDVRDVDYVEPVDRRPHAARLDEVVARLDDVQQHVRVARIVRRETHGRSLPDALRPAPHRDLHRFGVEAQKLRPDHLIRPARKLRVARRRADPIGRLARSEVPGDQQKGGGLTNERGAEQHRHHPDERHAREGARETLEAASLHGPAIVDRLAAIDDLFEKPPGESR